MQLYNSLYIKSQKTDNVGFSARPIPENILKKLESKMLQADNIDIFCHSSPDEDTVNAAKTLADFFSQLDKKVRIFAEGKLNGIFLENIDKSIIHDPDNIKDYGKATLAVIVDFNSKSRLSEHANNLLKQYKKIEIIGMDHHQPAANEELIGNINNDSDSPFYIDAAAKSCCGVVYRFFEGLRIKISETNLSSLYCGMLDDLLKFGCVTIEHKNGNYELIRTKAIYNNPETIEILDDIERKLPKKQQEKILKHLDILSNLTEEAKTFQAKLFREKIKVTNNGNLAYIEIPPEDQEWIRLGQDNIVTSKILSNLRQRLLKKNPDDDLISDNLRAKLDKIKGAAVFYRGPVTTIPSLEVYKVSIHSKDGYALKLVAKVLELNKDIQAGGHSNRIGGKIHSIDLQECEKFIKSFINAAECREISL